MSSSTSPSKRSTLASVYSLAIMARMTFTLYFLSLMTMYSIFSTEQSKTMVAPADMEVCH